MSSIKEDVSNIFRKYGYGRPITTISSKTIDDITDYCIKSIINELKRIDNEVEDEFGEGFYDAIGHWFGKSEEFRGACDYDMTYSCRRITQLSSQLTNNKEDK